MDHLQSIVTGVAPLVAMYLLARAAKRPAPRVGSRRVLTYGLGVRIFSALFAPSALLFGYAALHMRPTQRVVSLCAAAAFVLLGVAMAYLAFLVRVSYDEEFLYFSSPLKGAHRISWTDVTEVGYSHWAQCNYIRSKQVSRIWYSHMQLGYDELGEFLKRKHDELYGAAR